MNTLLLLLTGYLLGSISFSYLIVRLVKGIDIRTVGSHNAGGRNVMLHVGQGWGWLVGILDTGKGALAAWMGLALGGSPTVGVLAGLMVVLGHNYPFYLGFRGGKGIAASIGALLVLMLEETVIGLAVLGVMYFLVTHSIAFSSGLGFLTIAGMAWFWGQPLLLILTPIICLLIGILAVLPEAVRSWVSTEDKRQLVLNQWIRVKGDDGE
jgi:glycerol-3-phosphate acyltransferase PlsY